MKLQIVGVKSIKSYAKKMAPLLKPLVKEAYLFGSAVEGSAIRYESDVDLLLVPAKPISLARAYKILDRIVEDC